MNLKKKEKEQAAPEKNLEISGESNDQCKTYS